MGEGNHKFSVYLNGRVVKDIRRESNMAKFLGRFRHTLDHKGRVAIPARFRRALPPESHDTFTGFYRNDGAEICLTLYCASEFSERLAAIAEESSNLAHVRRLKRAIYAKASDFQIDPQGRIAIPQDLKNELGLEKDVLFVGIEDTVEVWSPEKFEAYLKEGEGLTELEYRVFGKGEGDVGG
jgi:MraZ protein